MRPVGSAVAPGGIGRPAEPGIIGIFLDHLFQREVVRGGGGLLRLLLLRLRVGAIGILLVDRPQGLGTVFGKEDVDPVGDLLGVAKIELDMEGGVARRRRLVQLLDHGDDRVEILLRVGRDDEGVGGRLAGDADLAIQPPDIAVRLRLRP